MTFEDLLKTVEKSMELDPWVRDANIEGYCDAVHEEAEEVVEALKNQDYRNLKEELGDVIYGWVHLCKLAEEQGHFTMDEVMQSAIDKLHRRKPYLKENRKVTKEQALKYWYEAKDNEKHR